MRNLWRTEYIRQEERTENDWEQMKVRGIYKEMHWGKIEERTRSVEGESAWRTQEEGKGHGKCREV